MTRTFAAHLLPGVAVTAVFALTAPLLSRTGLPPVWGMFLAVLLVIVPLGLITLRRHTVDLAWPKRRELLTRFLPTLLVAAVAPGLVAWAEPLLGRVTDRVLPSWWQLDPRPPAGSPQWVWLVTIIGWLLTLVLVGPVIEEIYFRGFLLPRLAGRPWLAVVAHSLLFSGYHVWQPKAFLTVFVFTVPLAVIARRPRGVTVAVLVHVVTNALAFAALLSGMLSR